MKKLLLVLLLATVSARAENTENFRALVNGEDFHYSDYYQIKEDPSHSMNLLNFEHKMETFPYPAVPYNRDSHFGGWLRDNSGEGCLNTRGKVLVRDAVGNNVTYTADGCTVQSGRWNEPYTGRLHTSANQIQIDHIVALKNAYMTGAHEWTFLKRCLYANYMGNKFHLISADGPENLRKSDHTPAGYIPPNKAYTCQFLKQWLNVKLIWSLRVTPPEAAAIQRISQAARCSPESFEVSAASLKEQRDFMQENAGLCERVLATPSALERF